MITIALFILGLILLVKGADLLVDGSVGIARRFNISQIVIGLTIVAFGTSMPELVVNLLSTVSGNTEIAIGNILGSNIANIFLILGVSAMIFPLAAKKNTIYKEIPFSLFAAAALGFLANDIFFRNAEENLVTRFDGGILLLFFAIFMVYTVKMGKNEEPPELDYKNNTSFLRSIMLVSAGLTALLLGGKWIVDGAVQFATQLGLSQTVIALTIVAVGTSLPELATSAMAAYKKQTDIAIGNVIGSNIFNIFWILGLNSLIKPLPFSQSINKDIVMIICATAVLFALMFLGKKHTIERWQGALMVCFYIGYVIYLVVGV